MATTKNSFREMDVISEICSKNEKEQANRLQDEEYSLKELMLVTRDDIEEIIKKENK